MQMQIKCKNCIQIIVVASERAHFVLPIFAQQEHSELVQRQILICIIICFSSLLLLVCCFYDGFFFLRKRIIFASSKSNVKYGKYVILFPSARIKLLQCALNNQRNACWGRERKEERKIERCITKWALSAIYAGTKQSEWEFIILS